MNKKKAIISISLALVLIATIVVGVILLLPKKNPEPEIPSTAKVLSTISDKLEETADSFAKCASGSSTSAISVSQPIMSLAAPEVPGGFRKKGASEYLWLYEMSSRIVFAVGYLANNATTENGYANGFEYNKIYMGALEVDGFSGVVYIKTDTDQSGINLYFDFKTTEESTEICFIITMHADYDFENNVVKNVKMNYAIMPIMTELWAVEYDFVNNNFRGFQLYDNTNSHTPEQATEILNSYNDGTLRAEKLMSSSIKWTYGSMVSGNITNDINNLSFDAYEYSSGYTDNLVSQLEISEFYNVLYNSLHSFKLRTPQQMINSNSENVQIVNYIQDCVDYGWNKANYSSWSNTENGKEYYLFHFVEYEEMINHLTSIKNTILADESATNEAKELITEALNYVTSKGKVRYTGQLGTYNGLSMEIEYWTNWNEKPISEPHIKAGSTEITYNLVDGQVANLTYNKVSA